MRYVEIGFGNPTLISSEIEEQGHEVRLPGRVPLGGIVSLYLRVWIGRTVFILDTAEGYRRYYKPKSAVKLVVGLRGW